MQQSADATLSDARPDPHQLKQNPARVAPRRGKQLKLIRKSVGEIRNAIATAEAEVQELFLSRCQLKSLPVENIFQPLSDLIKLNLSNNELARLPPWISNLKLESLNLSKNKFEAVPPVVFMLTGLKTLSLSDNFLHDGLPDISRLVSLRSLDLRGCGLRQLPLASLQKLPNLETMFLDDNLLPADCNRTDKAHALIQELLSIAACSAGEPVVGDSANIPAQQIQHDPEKNAEDEETEEQQDLGSLLVEANQLILSPLNQASNTHEKLRNPAKPARHQVDVDSFWSPCLQQLASLDTAEQAVCTIRADSLQAALTKRHEVRRQLSEYLREFSLKAQELTPLLVENVEAFPPGPTSETGDVDVECLVADTEARRKIALEKEQRRVSIFSKLALFCKLGALEAMSPPPKEFYPFDLLEEAKVVLWSEIELKEEFQASRVRSRAAQETKSRNMALHQLSYHHRMLSVIRARAVELDQTISAETNIAHVMKELKVAARELKRAKIRLKYAEEMASALPSDDEVDQLDADLEKAQAEVPPARLRYKRAMESVLVLKENGYPELECPSVYFQDPLKDVPVVAYSDLAQLADMEQIGHGGASDVFLAKLPGIGEVAFKRFRVQRTVSNKDQLKKEANVMYTLRSPRIIQLLGVCLDEQQRGLILEYSAGGSLYSVLHEEKIRLSPERTLLLGANVIDGLIYLHSNRVLHLDLKSANILLDAERLTAKIGDFGTSRIKRDTMQITKVLGTVGFMAPEMLQTPPIHNTPCDVYSFGMLLLEMCTNRIPFSDMDHLAAVVAIQEGKRPDTSGISKPFLAVVEACWRQQAAARPSASQLMTMFVEKQLTCMICLESFFPSTGVICSANRTHFLCESCIDGAMHSHMGRNHVSADSSMTCEGLHCDGGSFPFDSFAPFASPRTLTAWTQAVFSLREKQLVLHHEREVDSLRERLLQGGTVVQAKVDLIAWKIQKQFELRCPSCGIGLEYTNGCLALCCGDDRCRAHFCGYCWEVSANRTAAHSHLSYCPYNFRKPDWFGGENPMNTWERAQKLRHIRALRVLINEVIPPELLEAVLKSCSDLLDAHGVSRADLINYQ